MLAASPIGVIERGVKVSNNLKFRIVICLTVATAFLSSLSGSLLAQTGANLSLPFARRSRITPGQDYSSSHRAIDYRAQNGTSVVAAHEGKSP